MQLERDVGRTITPTVPEEQEYVAETQVDEFPEKLNQPTFCRAAGLFPPQASLASLRLAAAALLVVIRQVRSRKEMKEEVRSTMLVASVPLPLGLYEATVN